MLCGDEVVHLFKIIASLSHVNFCSLHVGKSTDIIQYSSQKLPNPQPHNITFPVSHVENRTVLKDQILAFDAF